METKKKDKLFVTSTEPLFIKKKIPTRQRRVWKHLD